MGSTTHVVGVTTDSAAAADLLNAIEDRVEELESRWSRFRDDSEISTLNANAGEWVEVSDDTVRLMRAAQHGWSIGAGFFDPTVLGDVIRAGYDRTLEDVIAAPHAGSSLLRDGIGEIEVEANRIRLPEGVGFDPGGIGKGLTVDTIIEEFLGGDVAGLLINMGGDLRVAGLGPDATTWTINLDYEGSDQPLATVGLIAGAVATSTTLKRHWDIDGQRKHHLIDPRSGEPSDSQIDHVAVIASTATEAEILAKATLIRGGAHPFDLIDGTDCEALIVNSDRTVEYSRGFTHFTAGLEPAKVVAM
jgi:thiamine biosynthesis lipoprotein